MKWLIDLLLVLFAVAVLIKDCKRGGAYIEYGEILTALFIVMVVFLLYYDRFRSLILRITRLLGRLR